MGGTRVGFICPRCGVRLPSTSRPGYITSCILSSKNYCFRHLSVHKIERTVSSCKLLESRSLYIGGTLIWNQCFGLEVVLRFVYYCFGGQRMGGRDVRILLLQFRIQIGWRWYQTLEFTSELRCRCCPVSSSWCPKVLATIGTPSSKHGGY